LKDHKRSKLLLMLLYNIVTIDLMTHSGFCTSYILCSHHSIRFPSKFAKISICHYSIYPSCWLVRDSRLLVALYHNGKKLFGSKNSFCYFSDLLCLLFLFPLVSIKKVLHLCNLNCAKDSKKFGNLNLNLDAKKK